MEDFKLKLDLLNYKPDMQDRLQKHWITLQLASLENMQKVIGYLLEKGVIEPNPEKMLIEPDDFTVLNIEYEELKQRIEALENINELGALTEDLSRINSKGAAERLTYLKDNNETYKSLDGKYSNVPFRLAKFIQKYGNINKEKNTEKEIANIVSMETAFSKEEKPMVNNDNPFEDILSKPQVNGLNPDTYFRYERLYDSIKNIMVIVYGIEEVDNNIVNNLIKLVTSNIKDDKKVMYYAITYGKNVSPDEKLRLEEAISEETDYTNIMSFNLGRTA